MSYPITNHIGLAPSITAASSYTPDLSGLPTTTNDDYVFLCVSAAVTSGTLSVSGSGWVEEIELDVTLGCRMAVYYCKVASGTVATPTITLSAGSGMWQCVAWVERDADATDPVDNSASVNPGSAVTSMTSATLTPGTDNCRVIYFATTRASGSSSQLRMLEADAIGEVLQDINDGSVYTSVSIGSVMQGTAAATAKTVYINGTGKWSGVITFAIKNKASGKRARYATPGLSRVMWCGSFGSTHDAALTPSLSSWGAPANGGTTWDGSGNINGIAVSATNATRTTDVSGPVSWGTFDQLATAVNGLVWQGSTATFAADIDMTGKLFSMEFFSTFPSGFNDEGLIVVFENNAGTAWKAYKLTSKLGWGVNNLYTSIIDVNNSTPYASGGSLDMATVRKISLMVHRRAVATSVSFAFRHMALLSKTTLVGGNATTPLNVNYARNALHGWSYAKLVGGEYPAATIKADIQFGDGGTTETYVDATGTLTTFPSAYNVSSQREWNVGPNQVDVTVKAGASDTINLIATSVSASQEQNFTFDAASSASAAYSMAGASIIGMATTLLPEALSSSTFSGCAPVATKGANLTNCIVTATTATSSEAAVTVDTSGSTLDGCTIDVTGTSAGYHLELGTVVTAITLTDVTFTGTPGTDKVHVLKTSGTVTITISGTTSLVAGDVTTEGATVVIAAPSPTLDATVLASTRAVLYNRTADAEISNTLVAGTSWTHTVTSGASSGDVLDLYTFKEGYQESVATIIYTGADATFAVQQAVDDAIDYYRTAESVTDYTTLTEFNFYAPDIYIQSDDADGATSLKRMFIFYNGALTTEDGARYMRGGVTFRSAFDVVINRSVVALAVDNVSVTHGLHFTDESTIRVTTDDGTSWIAPPSAPGSIRYAFGVSPGQIETGVSGLTGPESAQLMALPSASANATAVVGAGVLTVPKFLGLK